MQVPANNVVGLDCGVSYPAGHLFYVERTAIEREYFTRRSRFRGQKTESWWRFMTPLDLASSEIDRAAGDPAGGSRLEAARFKSKLSEGVA